MAVSEIPNSGHLYRVQPTDKDQASRQRDEHRRKQKDQQAEERPRKQEEQETDKSRRQGRLNLVV